MKAIGPAIVAVFVGLMALERSEPAGGYWPTPLPSAWAWAALVPLALAAIAVRSRIERARPGPLRVVWDADRVSLCEGPLVRVSLRWSEASVRIERRLGGEIFGEVTYRDPARGQWAAGCTGAERRLLRERARFAMLDCALGVIASLTFFVLS